jgi:hypothetical protein
MDRVLAAMTRRRQLQSSAMVEDGAIAEIA